MPAGGKKESKPKKDENLAGEIEVFMEKNVKDTMANWDVIAQEALKEGRISEEEKRAMDDELEIISEKYSQSLALYQADNYNKKLLRELERYHREVQAKTEELKLRLTEKNEAPSDAPIENNKSETEPDQFEEVIDFIRKFKNRQIQKIKEGRLTESEKNNVIHLYLLWGDHNKKVISQLPEDKRNKIEEERIQANDEIKKARDEFKNKEITGITKEAEDFIKSAETGIPAFVTNKLKKICKENGIDDKIIKKSTPNELVEILKTKKEAEEIGGVGKKEDAEKGEGIKDETEKKSEEDKPPLRKMEEIEKERAQRAQKEIDSQKSDYEKAVEEIEKEQARETDKEKTEHPEGQNNIEQLKLEVEQARKDYLEIDYKKKKAWKRMTDFFGSVFKGEKEDDEGDKEVAYYRAIYDNKLFNYKNALLEDAKTRGASGKELGNLVKFFDTEAKVNLADTHTQVKIENQEKRFFGFIKKSSTDLINWYRRLPMVKKIAVGVAFGLGSVGAVYAGGAVAGAMAGAAAMRRVFLGAVTGTTVTIGAEALTHRRTEKGIAKEAENFAWQAEGLSEEERIKMADARIKGIIYDENREINKIKNKNLRNLSLGIAAGAGSMLLPKLLGGRMAEFFGYHAETPSGSGKIPFAETPKISETPVAPEIPAVPEAPEVLPVKLTFEEGSSLVGKLTDYVNNHQAEIYEHHPELRKFNPGQIAYRMYADYVEEHPNPLYKSLDLIYPGAEAEINPATLEISSFSDTKGTIGRAIEQVAGNHDKWTGMKNLSLKELAGTTKNKIMGLSGEYGKFWGPEAEIKSGEKIKDWITRVVRLAVEKK